MVREIVLAMRSIALTLLFVVLSGCGSSSSATVGDPPVLFSDPTDAESLSAAISTGTSGTPSSDYWECRVRDGNSIYEYRFLSDGTGLETDQNNGGAQSVFTWQALSATSMVTTITATGAQLSLTNIQFAGSNSISLSVNDSISLDCSRLGGGNQPVTIDLPAGENSLSYGGTAYALTHGFEESFSFSPDARNDTHRTSQFQTADAEFKLLQIITGGGNPLIIWRPDFASVWLRADLHSPGGDGFQSATFEYEPDDIDEKGPEVAGRFFFNDASLGVDLDGVDGIDADTNEFIDVVAGTISVTRHSETQATMSFDLSLEDGTTLTGTFTGAYPVYQY